jgi:polyphosphate glucokinase
MKVLGIDIGGSAVKGAPVDTATGKLLQERFRVETPKPLTPRAMAETIADLTRHFHWRGRIGVGFPGVVHGSRTMTSANLHQQFIGLDTGGLFAKATGCPIAMINDADAAGIAEMKFGAGREKNETVLLLTLGTGVGSALFYNGELFPNTELGHFPIRGKSAERFISSAARKRRGLTWQKWGAELGAYLRTLECLLWPELIIIGGGVSSKKRKFFRYVKCRTPIVAAAAQNEAGMVGAALWAEQRMRREQSPASRGKRSN